MLRNSFIFLDRVGQRTERGLWDSGVRSWNDFLTAGKVDGFSSAKKSWADRGIGRAKQAILEGDVRFFHQALPSTETWRILDTFSDVAYVDIETSHTYGSITVVGVYDGLDTKMFVRGFNLDPKALYDELARHEVIVTFNGASFDLPIIQRFLGRPLPRLPHVDMRHVCARVGLSGGLKKIEQELGITRPDHIRHVYGADAVMLWHKWERTRDRKYLDLLIEYNQEDILNLEPLVRTIVPRLWNQTFG
ncbi:MAG: ribonuclease H-like domain-containing protein [Nanoarchaeota archaeon]